MNLANFVRTKKEQILRRFVRTEVQVVEKIVEVDAKAAAYERENRKFAAHVQARYGITYDELFTDFPVSRIAKGKSLKIFFNEYYSPEAARGWWSPVYAIDKMHAFHGIEMAERAKMKKEIDEKFKTIKAKVHRALNDALKELAQEEDK